MSSNARDESSVAAYPKGLTAYVYGVRHVQDGVEVDLQRHVDRDAAERGLAGCRSGDLNECHLVRMPVGEWERVPDGK